jgi:hypothetical protein
LIFLLKILFVKLSIRPDIWYPALTGYMARYPVSGFWLSQIFGRPDIRQKQYPVHPYFSLRYSGPVEGNPKQMLMVFASDSGVQVLRRAETISVDGTFTSCPPPFVQVFIIMASLPQGSSIPAVFGLLPNKNTKTYTHFFQIVASLAEDMFKGNF